MQKLIITQGSYVIEISNETKRKIDTIVSYLKNIHSSPLDENKWEMLQQTFIDFQFYNSNNYSSFKDVLDTTTKFLNLFISRIEALNNSKG